jgi:hypothetical protein
MLRKIVNMPRAALQLLRKPTELQSKPPLRVKVLIAQDTGVKQHQLLVFPEDAVAEVPDHLHHLSWRHLATTNLREKLLAPAAPVIEAEIGSQGHSLLTLTR